MTTNESSQQSSAQTLLNSLARELFQTETSASRHCRREADRLGQTPPAAALRAVAEHADGVLAELPGWAERSGLPVSKGGRATGALFSQLRDKMFDMLIDSQRSYRGTLLGCRHGVDVVRTLQRVAACSGNIPLDDFCAAWLTTRVVLVQRVEDELLWFAQHPEEAIKPARPLLAGVRARAHAASAPEKAGLS